VPAGRMVTRDKCNVFGEPKLISLPWHVDELEKTRHAPHYRWNTLAYFAHLFFSLF
jgi:hypothetical protein